MKKLFLFVIIVLFITNIAACANTVVENAAPEKTEAKENTEPIQAATTLPTEKPEKTAEPTPTDEGIDLSIEVEIPDTTLRTAILSTLSAIGIPAKGTITAEDMLSLEELAIVSFSWEAQQEELNYVSAKLSSSGLLMMGDGIESLEGLQYARNLTKLIILGNAPHLKGGTDNSFQDLSPLSELENLEMLSLRFNNLHDISPISELENLSVLELQYNLELQDISAISKLNNLSVLDLQHCYEADFNAISNLENLESLYLCGTIRLIALAELKNLKHLECREGDAVGIWELHELQNIRTLDLSFQHINDIGVLGVMSSLENLNLFENEIDDISVLSGLKNLKILAVDKDTYNNNADIINTLKDNGCQIYTEDIFPVIIRAIR